MKKIIQLFIVLVLAGSCNPKKTETTGVADSLTMDSSVLATQPAPSALAFSPISGFFVNNKFTFKDSVNYFLLASQEELKEKFDTDKKSATEVVNPDFIINYVVAVACAPTQNLVTIVMDKVEVVDKEINVYLNIQYGAKQDFLARPSRIFAIERRDGMIDIQFWVNGKKDQAVMLM